MDFVKKHYEKILLVAVLLGLVGAMVFLPYMIASDKKKLEEVRSQITNPKVMPLPPVDLAKQTNVVKRLQSPYSLDFSTTNRLFNPVQWQKASDGRLIKLENGSELGERALVVTKITPLYLIISLELVVTNELGVRYTINFERQGASATTQRRGQRFVSTDDRKKDLFTLAEVKGAPENPEQLVLKMADTGEMAVISKDKPFQRIEGYSADLKYDPEMKKWTGQRIGSALRFYNDEYIIVAIGPDSVIIMAKSNDKKTARPYNP